jgi:hypothetical protein
MTKSIKEGILEVLWELPCWVLVYISAEGRKYTAFEMYDHVLVDSPIGVQFVHDIAFVAF